MSNPWEWKHIIPDDKPVYTAVTSEEINTLCGYAVGRNCLEIGSAWGYSAIMMARRGALHVTAIDFHQPCDSNCEAGNSQEVMEKNIKFYRVDQKVTMICKSSQEALPELQGVRYGLIFVDGDHSYDTVIHDVNWACRLLEPDGFIACHDYGSEGIEDVTMAVDKIIPGGPDYLAGTLYIAKASRFKGEVNSCG